MSDFLPSGEGPSQNGDLYSPKNEIKEEQSEADFMPTTSTPIDAPVSVKIDQPNIEIKVEKINECGVCGIVTTPLLKEDGQLGSDGSYEMSQISPHGRVYKHTVNEDEDTFWIGCDQCGKWFHGRCVQVEEYQDGLIEKFHCRVCEQHFGPSKLRQVIAPHRLAFDDPAQIDLPPEIGTRVWIEKFKSWEKDIPPPDENHIIYCEDGNDFDASFKKDENWSKVFLIKNKRALELRMPENDFTTADLIKIFGEQHQVDTIDVYRQVTHAMSLGSFHRRMMSPERDRIYNFLSLEFSKNEMMKELICPPFAVYQLSFVHKFWPDKSDPINYDPEMDFLPASASIIKEIEVAEDHKKSRPDVALFCLCGMGGSYTDFHIDFGGSSVWYHIYKGQKVFYIAEPSEKNLKAYEEHQVTEKRTERFLGDKLEPGELRRIVINEGETLMIPSGWIHAVYTPIDSLVFGGNFLHELNIPMQLRVYDIEQRTRAEIGMDEKFLFPQFELVHWYAARSILLKEIKENNDQGKKVSLVHYNATKAILPYLKQWMEKEEAALAKGITISISSNVEVYKKLKKEFEMQERMRRGEEGKKKKGSKKSKKKKRGDSDEDDDDYKPVKLKIARSRIKKPKSEEEDENPADTSVLEIPRQSFQLESEEETETFGIRFTKKGSKYSSEIVEKQTPMIGEVNVAKMFARRSSSGRTPKVADWLVAAAGTEIEKQAKHFEETGDMPEPRAPVIYSRQMDAIMAAEDKEDAEYEERRSKKRPAKVVKDISIGSPQPKKKALTTAKQRLASKLGLKRK